jgi:hypothetical protein
VHFRSRSVRYVSACAVSPHWITPVMCCDRGSCSPRMLDGWCANLGETGVCPSNNRRVYRDTDLSHGGCLTATIPSCTAHAFSRPWLLPAFGAGEVVWPAPGASLPPLALHAEPIAHGSSGLAPLSHVGIGHVHGRYLPEPEPFPFDVGDVEPLAQVLRCPVAQLER